MLVAQSCLFVTPWTLARQAPLFMKFSRQEYWGGLPVPVPVKMMVRPYQPTDKPNEVGKETERAEAPRGQEDEQKEVAGRKAEGRWGVAESCPGTGPFWGVGGGYPQTPTAEVLGTAGI